MHYESYHWQDHAPNPHRRRVDLALTIAFALLFSIVSLGSLSTGHGGGQSASIPADPETLQDAVRLANGGDAAHLDCRG